MSETLVSTTLEAVASLPATYNQTGYEALTFVAGECALQEVPEIMRQWAAVTEDLVCQESNFTKKGKASYSPVTFNLSRKPSDAMQTILTTAEADRAGVISLKLDIGGSTSSSGVLYFTAQVSKFAFTNGGNADTIHTSGVELLLQSDPVFVV